MRIPTCNGLPSMKSCCHPPEVLSSGAAKEGPDSGRRRSCAVASDSATRVGIGERDALRIQIAKARAPTISLRRIGLAFPAVGACPTWTARASQTLRWSATRTFRGCRALPGSPPGGRQSGSSQMSVGVIGSGLLGRGACAAFSSRGFGSGERPGGAARSVQ